MNAVRLTLAVAAMCVLLGACTSPYQAGNSIQEPMTQVVGMLSAGVNAQGRINCREYTGCGSAIGVAWSATKR